jgi:hypothetical protein
MQKKQSKEKGKQTKKQHIKFKKTSLKKINTNCFFQIFKIHKDSFYKFENNFSQIL